MMHMSGNMMSAAKLFVAFTQNENGGTRGIIKVWEGENLKDTRNLI